MRTRSQSRKLADLGPSAGPGAAISGPSGGSGAILTDPPAGSGPCVQWEATTARVLSLANPLLPSYGSEATANANRLRRCCVGESGRPTRLRKWRDWANLPTEMLEEIATRLLTDDVSEYLRFRSACKPWRKCTQDPSLSGGGLDRRFRPHHWIALSYCASPSRRRLINTRTGARAEVDRPELSTHHCFGIVDGLLVLCDPASTAVRLLNPLTGALTHFPPIADVRATKATRAAAFKAFFHPSEPLTEEEMRCLVIDTPKIDVPHLSAINGAAIDDSTTPPTLVLALRLGMSLIICAKPGDQYWVSVHFGEQRVPSYNYSGQIQFHTLLSFRGHCYVTTYHGHVMRVDLRGPCMVYLSREMTTSSITGSYSYLVRYQDHRMLMVRFLSHIALEYDPYPPEEFFMIRDRVPSRMEVFEVDVVGRRLIPLDGIGKYAAFVGYTYSVMLSTDKFPKLAPNAVYLNYRHQKICHLGIYHFKDKRICPQREFTRVGNKRFFPCACHWELADYLICDTERRL